MKKLLPNLLLFSITLMLALPLAAQKVTNLVKTTFVGALSADDAADWTKGWANWNPKAAVYPAPTDTVTLNAMISSLPTPGEINITGTLSLDASKVYLLKGLVVVRSGGKLIIPAGTVIRALADLTTTPKNYASILVERGGQIEATGSAAKPIVITSAKEVAQRERGDWGGVVLAGKALHNLLNGSTNDNVQMEGFNNVSFDANLARFGGTNPMDNSGIFRYVRLEFGGLAFEVNKEINGLTLGAVGSETELHHVQVSFCNDDSFEWFGGSVNASHLISFKTTDDDFDTDNGFSGLNQFGIGVRDPEYFDATYSLASGSSTSEGFESDNEGTGTAAVAPYTSAVFSNFTMVGPIEVGKTYNDLSSTAKSAFRRGARIRRNSSLRIANSIFMGYRNFLMLDGDSCLRNTNDMGLLALVNPSTAVPSATKQLYFTNNLIVNTAAAYTSTTDTTANGLVEIARGTNSKLKLAALTAWVRQTGCTANNIDPVAYATGTVLVNPLYSSATPDFRPVAGSPALSGADFTCNPVLSNILTDAKEIERVRYAPVYPNPITDGTLQFGMLVESYGIFDMNGRLLQYGFDTDKATINLPSGMYFIKLNNQVQKLIVR